MSKRLTRIAAFAVLGLVGATLAAETPSLALKKLFPDDAWILLSRPNTDWTPGDVLETASLARRDPAVIANIVGSCIPKEVWRTRAAKGGGVSQTNSFEYGFDVLGTLKKIGLNLTANAEAATSAVKTISLSNYEEETVLSGMTESWLIEKNANGKLNYEDLSFACKVWLVSSEYKVIGGIFRVHDGKITVQPKVSAKLGVEAESAAVGAQGKAGMQVATSDQAALVISADRPMVIAIRQVAFTKLLQKFKENPAQFGAAGAGIGEEPTLKEIMESRGLAIK